MKRKLSKADRQRIVKDYADRHGGKFEINGFLREVRASNGTHEAWPWFEWDPFKAHEEHLRNQAREFVQGLTITFKIEMIERNVGAVIVREAPAYISPVANRRDGGGYHSVDPNNPEHRAEIARQGLVALESWVDRYGGILETEGISTLGAAMIVKDLEAKYRPSKEDAA